MRRPTPLLAAGLITLIEAGAFGYLAAATQWAFTQPCPYRGVDPCVGRGLAILLIPMFAMVCLVLFTVAVWLVVRPGLVPWTGALMAQCFFLDLFALVFVALLRSGPKHSLPADLWGLLVLSELWGPPIAALLLLLVPGSLRTCFPYGRAAAL